MDAKRIDRAVDLIAAGYLVFMALLLTMGVVRKWTEAVRWAETSYASAER